QIHNKQRHVSSESSKLYTIKSVNLPASRPYDSNTPDKFTTNSDMLAQRVVNCTLSRQSTFRLVDLMITTQQTNSQQTATC
ncbi:hypothetical protein J6590_097335, partial [Homalodisca vitripennis]